MRIPYKVLLDAAHVLKLDATMTRRDERREGLYQVAEALLVVANCGVATIELEELATKE